MISEVAMKLWFGNQASHDVVARYQHQLQFDKVAWSRSPFDDEPTYDPTFGVMSDRKGLPLLEKVGEFTVVKVHGSLVTSYRRWHAWFPGEVTSYEALNDALAIAQEAGAKRVMLDISSGGGAVRGLDNTTKAIARLRRAGIVVDAHTDDAAFSAAYWIMASARQITAAEMAEQGSIGTFAVVQTMVNTEENFGVKFTVIKAGEFKAIGNPFEELGEKERQYLQDNVNQTNSFFLRHVANHRPVSLENSYSWAEGRTFFSSEALKLGLIDRIASLDDIIGSGAATNPASDRRFEMKISAEKLAQIQAGAAPEAVLNDAELKQYNEDLAADAADGGGDKGDGDKGGDKGDKGDGDGEGDKTAGGKKPDVQAGNTGMSEDLKTLLKQNGRLEAKVEQLEAQLAAAEESLTAAKAQANQLLVLGQAAVTNLQRATRTPLEMKTSPLEVLGQYTELQSKMAKIFPVGQQSQAAATEDDTPAQIAHWRHPQTKTK